jgi:hypothetical protein
VTLDECLQRVNEQFDDIAAGRLADFEARLRCHGCSDEEWEIERARLEAEHEAFRLRMLVHVRAWALTGSGVH